ncbi:hypothetical protein [Nocardiopsis suaedae]|uniref:DUF1963 domain-containing protein n=1 Tax=Nocardiopsis suaedae TaxID=3018444 RepID=A0ABT4TUB3_9ACTN|nr:hypothetical protein [Nocardiopsis suaedae]MDA2808258.1 hypothetical protein [Nocardiopsis suaedae]
MRPTPPPDESALEDHLPGPCVVHPEPVTEYPGRNLPEELKDALKERFERLEQEQGWEFMIHLAEAPGIKLGGYPSWAQDPDWPDCQTCGRRTEHLLTVASWEFDGGSWHTWLPAEDRPADPQADVFTIEPASSAQDAAGVMLGDVGGLYIFECRTCPDRPIEYRFDCS